MLVQVAGTPAGLIMKVDPPYIEVFRARQTEGKPYEVGDKEELDGLYCEEVIQGDERLLVENALKSEKCRDNPDVELGMISYPGYPLKWPNGKPFGTICVLGEEERSYSDEIVSLLRHFKELVEAQLELLCKNGSLGELKQGPLGNKKESRGIRVETAPAPRSRRSINCRNVEPKMDSVKKLWKP